MVINFGSIVRFVQVVFAALRVDLSGCFQIPRLESRQFGILRVSSIPRLLRLMLSLALFQQGEEGGELVRLLWGVHAVQLSASTSPD